jgi:phosphoribosylaminoimidazole carboxylase PurE protein
MRQARAHVLMGSKSDKGPVKESGLVNILCEVLGDGDVIASVFSAHRNLEPLADYVSKACESGAKVFVGIAGLAAALPGALAGASGMTKPVIAVPLDQFGVNSCIIMPPGVPVLTSGLGVTDSAYPGLTNAGIAACQILAVDDPQVEKALQDYLARTAKEPEFDIDLSTLKKEKKTA